MGDISARALETLRKADVVACEDTRITGKLLSANGIEAVKIPCHEHNMMVAKEKILGLLREGKSVALVSDAGMPLISDPGASLVKACLEENFLVTCVPGASASLAALALSGLSSKRFLFSGFLPSKAAARRQELSELRAVPATLIFYETAPRLIESLGDMLDVLGDRPAAVARELTKKFEEVRRGQLSELASHYDENGAPKGEIVVLVSGPQEEEQGWTEQRIDALLAGMMRDKGMSLRDAVAAVAGASGWKKTLVYQRALKMKDQ